MEASECGLKGQQWLRLAEMLLAARDFTGARRFARRAVEADSKLQEFADKIVAVAQTIVAGDLRVIENSNDYYTILQVGRLTQSPDVICSQYRKLFFLLNPDRNHLPFANDAFRLVSDAWHIFSDPKKKSAYDLQLDMSPSQERHRQNSAVGNQQPWHDTRSPSISESSLHVSNWKRPQSKTSTEYLESSFWTACPYCLTMHEYLDEYEDCVLRCQTCKRAFQAVKVPPPSNSGSNSYLYCKSPFPIIGNNNGEKVSNGWSPFSSDKGNSVAATNSRKKTYETGDREAGRRKMRKMCGDGDVTKSKFCQEDAPPIVIKGTQSAERGSVHEINLQGIDFFGDLDEILGSLPNFCGGGDDKLKPS